MIANIIYVVVAITAGLAVFGLLARRGRLVSGLIFGTATYLVVGRLFLYVYTSFQSGPFKPLYNWYAVNAVLLLILALVVGMIGARFALRFLVFGSALLAVAALVIVAGAPYGWVGDLFGGHSAKAECLKHAPDKSVCTQVQTHPGATTPSPSASPADCKDGFTVAYDPHTGNRVASKGLDIKKAAPAALMQSIEIDKHNVSGLFESYNKISDTPASSEEDFISSDKRCYNDRGIQAWNDVRAVLTSKLTKVEKTVIPAGTPAYNTAVVYGHLMQYKDKLKGDLTSIKVTLPNGNQFYYLYRCKNLVAIVPIPGVPIKPPPPPPTPPTSTPTCKPGVPSGSPSCLPCYSPGNGPTPVGAPQPGQTICPGKNPSHGIANDPVVPPFTKGCGADGGVDPNNCTGGTQTSHPTQASPAPATGTTQCGVDGNDPCASPSPRPAPTQPPAPSGAASPPAPGGGGGNYPAPSAPSGAPSSSPSPISGDPGRGAG